MPIALAVVGVCAVRRRGGAGLRTASRWMLRGFLLATGGAAAVALGANPAFASTLTVTYTGAANPTTNTPLTWSVTQNPAAQMSCELDFGATVVSPLANCGPTVTYSVAGGPAGTYTLVAYGDAAANVTATSKTLSSSIAVAPVAPTPSGPTGPSNSRAPQWSLGLPAGATGACTLTTSTGTVVGSADPCPDPWTGPLGAAADGQYTLSVIARQGGLTSAPGTLEYTLDTTAPSAATVSAPAPIGNDRTPTFAVAGVEAGASVGCTATGPNGAVPVTSCTTSSAKLDLTGQPEGSYRLDVVVTDVAGNPSPTAFASYQLDVTPPPAPTVSTPPALTRQKTMTLTIGGSEAGATVTCVLTSPGGSTVFSGACPANGTFDTTGFADGVYRLVVTATDAAGNTSSTSVSWQRDTTPPPAPVITGPTPVKDRTPTLDVTDAEPGVSLECAIAGPSPANVTTCGPTTVLDFAGSTDGDYVVVVTATDAAGNSRSTTFTITLDTTAPPAPVVTGPTTAVNDRTPSLSVSDAEAGVTYSCSISGPDAAASVTACSTTTTLDLTAAADGDYVVTVTAADAAGNSSSSSFSVTLDTVAPPAPTVPDPASLTRATSVTVVISDTEAGVNLSCQLTAPSGATVFSGACPAGGSFDTAGFGDGVYTLVVTATDAAGNSSATTVTWTRDTTAPPVPSVSGVASLTNSRSVSAVIGDAEAGLSFSCVLTAPGGGSVFSGACPSDGVFDTTGFADGVYTLVVTATDDAGNSSSRTVTWTRDTVAPPAPSATAPGSPAQDRSPSFTVSDSESGVTFTCTVTGPSSVTVTTCGPTTTIDLSGAADGTYVLHVTATDAAGNTSLVGSATYVLDTTAPPAPAVSAPPTLTNSTSVTLTVGDAEPGVTITCVLTAPGGAAVSTGACPAGGSFDTAGFGDGVYKLVVTATDAAGNRSATTVSWVRDTTAPPAPTATVATPTRSISPTVTIGDTESGVVLTCDLAAPGGGSVFSGVCPSDGMFDTTGFGDGVYTLVVTATDAAGNSSSTTVTWTRDTVAPPAPSVTAPASPAQDRSPSFTVSDSESGLTFTCTVTGPSSVTVTTCGPTTTINLSGAADGTYVLHVTATDAAGNTSIVGSASYVLDTTAAPAPVVTAPASPAQGRTPSFTVSDSDPGVTFTCTVSGPSTVTVTSCGATTTIDLTGAADGTYVLTVRAVDAAGNVGPASSASYVLDTTAPPAPAVSAPPALTKATATTLSISDTEAGVTLTCRLTAPDGSVVFRGLCPADGVFDTSGFGDGVYTLRVTATDAAGNATSTTVTWTRDTTAPPVPVVTGSRSPAQGRTPSFSVTDAEAGVTYMCSVTGPSVVTVSSCGPTTTLDLSGAADGTYVLHVTATDAAGNTSAAGSASYVLDTTAPPAPTVIAPGSPAQGRAPSFTLSDSESGVTFTCSVSGPATVTIATCGATTTIDLRGAPDGTYTVTVSAIDAAGNVSASSTASYLLDTTAPAAPSVTGVPGLTNSRSVSASISDAEAGVQFTCVLTSPGGAVVRSGACPADGVFDTTGFVDGVYTLRVTATDAAGNSSTTTVTWTRDTAPPPAPSAAAPRSPAQSRTPSFTVTDPEAGVTYVCSVTGPSAATVTSCGPTTKLSLQGADGTYTVTISAVDAAGNISSSTRATYVLDTTAPAQPSVGVTPSPAQGRHPLFTVSGVEAAGVVACSLSTPNGSTVSVPVSCGPGVSLDLTGQPDGRYTLTVTVTDAAGNTSVAGVATYVLDTTAPAAPVVTPPANPSNDVTPTFDISSEPGATLTCSVAHFFQTVWSGPCPADGTLDLSGYSDGEFEVTVFATDAAGNVGPSTTVVYLLDTTAPDRPVLTAPASPSPVTKPAWLWTDEAGATSTCAVTNSGGTVVIGPVACTSSWTGDLTGLPDGAYTFTVVATDAAGNTSAAATSVFVLDRQAPIPPSVVPPASPSHDMSPTWQISGPRNAVLTCTLTLGRKVIWGPATCPASGTFSLAGLPDGTYTLRVTATDNAGNVSAVSVTTYVLDTTPPASPTLDYGTSSPSTDTTPFWGFTLPPGTSGRCELLRGGTVIASRNNCAGAVRFDLAGRPEGTYVVKIYAVDAAGNESQPLVITYVLGHASPVPPTSSTGGTSTPTGTTSGTPSAGGRRPGGGSPAGLATAPGAARQPLDEINRLSSLIRTDAKHTVQKAAAAVSSVIPVIHDKITENVSHAVQGVVNAVSSAGGGTGFPLILLLVVVAFLLVQNRIDSRDPKLALASVAADDTVEFLPPPSRGGNR